MRSKLLLHLLTARPRSGREGGFTMIAGILVILALVVGTLGVVAIVNGANLGVFGSGEARDSQQGRSGYQHPISLGRGSGGVSNGP